MPVAAADSSARFDRFNRFNRFAIDFHGIFFFSNSHLSSGIEFSFLSVFRFCLVSDGIPARLRRHDATGRFRSNGAKPFTEYFNVVAVVAVVAAVSFRV